jgi:integrase
MNLSYAPNIILPRDAIAPDNYIFNSGVMPEDNFVVSRNKNGEIISVYGHLSWNRTPYSPNGKTAWLRFPFWDLKSMDLLQQSLHENAKWIIFIIMWYRTGIPLSQTSLKRYCNFLQTLSNYCYNKNIKLLYFFNNDKEIKEFSESKNAQSYLNNLSSLISELRRIPPEISGYNICSPKKITFLSNKLLLNKQNNKQTAPIPTRIYSELICNISIEIENFLKVSDKIFILIKKCLESQVYGRGKYALLKYNSKNIQNKMQGHPSFLDILEEHGLLEYFKENELTLSVLGINSLLSNIQILTKLQIHIFTGMRDSEVNNLPYNCLEKNVFNGVSHHVINGYTTKFNNGLRKEVRWVTSEEGHKAIQVSQKIADLIYSYLKIEDKSKNKPLFISTGYLPFTIKQLNPEILTPTDFRLYRSDFLLKRICPIIDEQDILELENIDLHRAWRSEDDYQIGKRWPIRTHQLRRSLALYAQRTGLVSLPSLRRQLKHITNEMSMYYAKGSSYAKNLINEDKDHFGTEWQESQPISSALSYIANVLLSEEKLIGGHGNWVEHRLKNNKNTVIIESREETIKRFKKGEIAYKETLLGGCTKIGSCDQPALNWLDTDCLTKGCKNMVCNVPKLEKVIIAQEKLVNSLDRESLEYRTENADLNALISAKNKLIKG